MKKQLLLRAICHRQDCHLRVICHTERAICHSFAVSFSLHGFSHTFWTVIFKEAKFEGSLSQLISFSFPSSCDLISGVSSSSLMRVDYHSLLLWIGYPRVYLYLEFFPRWIFLLALSVRAICRNGSSSLPRQFARYARLHGCGERWYLSLYPFVRLVVWWS